MYYRVVLVNYRICNIMGKNLTILKLNALIIRDAYLPVDLERLTTF